MYEIFLETKTRKDSCDTSHGFISSSSWQLREVRLSLLFYKKKAIAPPFRFNFSYARLYLLILVGISVILYGLYSILVFNYGDNFKLYKLQNRFYPTSSDDRYVGKVSDKQTSSPNEKLQGREYANLHFSKESLYIGGRGYVKLL